MGIPYGENFIILTSTVFEIFAAQMPKITNFVYRDLETRVRGHLSQGHRFWYQWKARVHIPISVISDQ